MNSDLDLYFRVSALMFMEFAVWGAWMPVLAMRLLGPLKMTGKQTGWVFATFPLASIFAPFVSGYLADKYFDAAWIILASHLIGAILLFFAAKQTKFWGMFFVMFAYSIFYTGTLPLIAKILYSHVASLDAWVWLWAPVSWALIGYFLTGMRQIWKMAGDGPDNLYLASILSLIMVAVCLIQPATSPKVIASASNVNNAGNPILEALGMLQNFNYLLFIIVQLVVAGMMQFYFLGSGQFMQDRGISGRNVSATMGIAQAFQALGTIFGLQWLVDHAGYQWTFVIGSLCWTILYVVYVFSKRHVGIIVIQAFHGLAYVYFIIAGQKFVGSVAPAEISGSALSLLAIATTGIGLFLGTQLAGYVMEKNSVAGKFQWSKIWSVPLAITLAGAIALAAFFKAPTADDFKQDKPAAEKAVAAANLL